MNSRRHARVKELFLEASRLPVAQQEAFVDSGCGDDHDLRDEVLSLLKHHRAIADRSLAVAQSRETRPRGWSPEVQARVESLFGIDHAGSPETGSPAAVGEVSRLPIGRVLADRYRIVSQLGRGGMGEVLAAHDLVLDQQIALKFLTGSSPARLGQLLNEVRLARKVTHPNVCRVYDVGEVDGEPFLSMEAVDGEDLHSLLRRIGRVPGDKVLDITRQLCAGLAAAHARGVLHRDLKPSNVLIDRNGQIKITDFGIAVASDDVTANLLKGGTPAYMAPELLDGGTASVATDLYALGLLLYEIATGQPAFTASTLEEYRHLHREVTPQTPSQLVTDLHPALVSVITSCLEKDPHRRPRSALVVAAALPGIDPLRLAVEAGATPPPEVVAAAGNREELAPLPAVAGLLGTVLLLLAVYLFSDAAYGFNRIELRLGPEVLAHRAREVLAATGHDTVGMHHTFGFLQDVEAAELGLVDRSVLFWYRQASERMVPLDISNLLYCGTCIGPFDPPLLGEGMSRLILDPAGRLVMLEAVPEYLRPNGQPQVADWDALLRLAGLDPKRLIAAEPRLTPPFFADATAAWKGAAPGHPEQPIHVDAAAFHGRPVYFDLQLLREDLSDEDLLVMPASLRRFDLLNTVVDLVFVLLAMAALPLARRNLVGGRCDLPGARRLALAVTLLWFGSWLLGASHTPEASDEVTLLSAAAAVALLQGGLVWIYTLALEPWVRRLWPHTLVSWNRLLGGRLRDRSVGRSLLLGSCFGSAWALLVMLDQLAPDLLGLVPGPFPVDSVQLNTALSSHGLLASLLDLLVSAVYDGLFSLLLLLLLRLLLRRPWSAALAYVLIIGTLETLSGSHPTVSWLLLGLGVAAGGAYALVRFGLLTLTTGLFVQAVLGACPITSDPAAWHAGSGLLALAVVILVAALGFRLSQSGRLLLPDPGGGLR